MYKMVPKKRHVSKSYNRSTRKNKTTKGKYTKRTPRKCKRTMRKTNINWSSILNGAKNIGSKLLHGAKFAGDTMNMFMPGFNMIMTGLNIAGNLKNAISNLFPPEEKEDDGDTLKDVKKMQIVLISLSKNMVSKSPRMREHPIYTEMSKLYDDLDFIVQYQNTWDKIETQKQVYPCMERFKKILKDYDELTK